MYVFEKKDLLFMITAIYVDWMDKAGRLIGKLSVVVVVADTMTGMTVVETWGSGPD